MIRKEGGREGGRERGREGGGEGFVIVKDRCMHSWFAFVNRKKVRVCSRSACARVVCVVVVCVCVCVCVTVLFV